VLTRYHKLFGEETYFLTGTDEHGQKVQSAAEARGLDPQVHVDELVERFREIWKELEIDYDFFIRTTMPFHKKVVQDCLQTLFDKGEIYEDSYEGWYSVSEEMFYSERELVDGKSPLGKEVKKITEKNYFFKMSKYQDQLLKHIEDNPQFIQPDTKKNEVLGFLSKPLTDLCISRPKSRLAWGVELPFDKDYVTYVWFDALLNYVTALGYGQGEEKEELFNQFWQDAIHLIGKDILTTHSVYWPTMLMALEIPLPKQIFAHGWWLNEDDAKMSKSEGKVVSPLDMKDIVGVDGLRYFLSREIYLGNDAKFSKALVVSKLNAELANNLGNLMSRTVKLACKNFDGVPPSSAKDPRTSALVELALGTPRKVREEIIAMSPNTAIGHIVDLLDATNKYLDALAPWKAVKEDKDSAAESLYAALEVLRISAILLSPVMPLKMAELLERLGASDTNISAAETWGVLEAGSALTAGDPLFPRAELPS
ncbi:MAG: methionine--tRNA ligase, partial [Bdellovibrionales bacterium]|nr:methionine--tRNA ligase [Bdellovibrionales bacterium]